MKNQFLSIASVRRLFEKLGGKSVNKEACLDFQKYLEFQATIIGKIAIKNALYEGRKSIKKRDIKEAIKEIEIKE